MESANEIKYKCAKCKEMKFSNEFYKRKEKKITSGCWCKTCFKKHVRSKYDHEKARNAQLVQNYGITSEEYDLMFAKQNGKCACCGALPEIIRTRGEGKIPRFHVDHCHKTGKIRGLLCSGCNKALGYINDNLEQAKALVAFLEKHNSQSKEA